MNWKDANSTEINPDTPYPVVIDMPVKYITVKSFTYIALLVFFFSIFLGAQSRSDGRYYAIGQTHNYFSWRIHPQ